MSPDRKPPSFAGHAATYALGNIVSRLVGFLMLPIYTRFLTPADYGAVGLLIFSLSLLEPLFGARLARAVPRFYFAAAEGRSRRAVIWGALALTGVVSVVTTIAIALLRHPASRLLFGSDQYAVATGLFAINMLSQPLEYTGLTYLRLQERSRLFLGISMGKLLVQVVLNVLFVVYWRLGVTGVVLSGVITSLGVGVGLTLYIASRESPVLDWTVIRKMLDYCWPLWFSGIAGLYVGSSGAFYLRVFDSLSDVGLLELGLRFATAVGLLVWTPFFQHWEPISYRDYKEKGGREKFQAAFIIISALMLASGLGVSMFSEPVIKLMAAPGFHAAAHTVPLLTLGLILSNLVTFMHFGFLATDRTKLLTASQYIAAGVITIAYVTLIPKLGLEGAVIGQCLAFAINFTYVRLWTRRYFDTGIKPGPLYVFVAIAAVAYVCSNLLIVPHALLIDLTAKTLIFLVAGTAMALVAAGAIRTVSPSIYQELRWTLERLRRIGPARQPGR